MWLKNEGISVKITISDRNIGLGYPPFIIAEMSGNHNQSFDRAMAIVEAASKAKAHAIKLQTYTADTMTLDIVQNEFSINDPGSLWHGKSLYEIYQKAYTPWDWHKKIFDRCHELGLICFSTPFDFTAVDFLEEINVPAYKIASSEIVDIPLIRKIASTGKPMIISTGMANIAEIDEAIRTAREAGCDNIIMLKCTSVYPANPEDTNLLSIPHMRELFGVQVGISDHTMGLGVSVASVALGATVIEKHFTLNRLEFGVDNPFSIEPAEMTQLVAETKRAWEALGRVNYGPTEAEKKSLQFRRSLYIVKDVKAGEVLTNDNVKAIRPGLGLQPKYLEKVLGKPVNQDVKRGIALTWGMLF